MHLRCIDAAANEATEEYDVGCFKVYAFSFYLLLLKYKLYAAKLDRKGSCSIKVLICPLHVKHVGFFRAWLGLVLK